jgi:predicted ATPase
VIRRLAVENYRSLRDLRLALGTLTVITGGNGAGKSNVYRALHLLADAAAGRLGAALAVEGGLPSALWAGPEQTRDFRVTPKKRAAQGTVRSGAVRMSFGFADDEVAYELRLGLPIQSHSLFGHDPEVKAETISPVGQPRLKLLERRGPTAMVRDRDGAAVSFPTQLELGESVLSQLSEPHRFPLLSAVREQLRAWRFYHHVRTDADSPLRAPQVSTRTPVLAHDGRDLAAALQTILEIGDAAALQAAVAAGLDGASLEIVADEARFSARLRSPGVLRPFGAAELSDGTLRYLALLAALLSPRAPPLLVLNEPEQSLHPRLFEPLGAYIAAAAARTQVIVVSHAEPLVAEIARAGEITRIDLSKRDGETEVAGRRYIEEPPWSWSG